MQNIRMPQVLVVLVGAAILSAIILGSWFYFVRGTAPEPLPLASGDRIESWDFDGSHEDGAALEDRAKGEVKRLKDLLGSEEFTDYELYVSIAAHYESLGDGRKTYEYLSRALAIDSAGTSLAWHNLAVLLARVGALSTARIAYEKAATIQPLPGYQSAYLNFLTEHFADDTEGVEAAFSTAVETVGAVPHILRPRALWLAEMGRTVEAIAEWRKILPQVSPDEQTNIREEIRGLQATL